MRDPNRHVVTVPVEVNSWAYKKLNARFNVAVHLYNCYLGECKKRYEAYRETEEFKKAKTLIKQNPKSKQAKTLFNEAATKTGFYLLSSSKNGRNNSMEQFATAVVKGTWLEEHIDCDCRRSIVHRAWMALESAKRNKGKVRFKRFKQDPETSVEGTSMKSPLRVQIIDGHYHVIWSKVRLPLIIHDDAIIQRTLDNIEKVTYIRLKRNKVRGKWKYWVQLCVEGKAYIKPKHYLGTGIVGIDLGPSSVTWVGDDTLGMRMLVEKSDIDYRRLKRKRRRIERQISRQRKSNNPDNYQPNGVPKKRSECKRWVVSNREQQLRDRLAEIDRCLAETRKCSHGQLTNIIRSVGDVAQIDNDSYKGWQRNRYGKSILRHAPGMFVNKLKHKFEKTGGELREIDTKVSKSSQTCPACSMVLKKPLGERQHKCDCGLILPRDMTSAIVNKFTEKDNTLNLKSAQKFIDNKKEMLADGLTSTAEYIRMIGMEQTKGTIGSVSDLEEAANNLNVKKGSMNSPRTDIGNTKTRKRKAASAKSR